MITSTRRVLAIEIQFNEYNSQKVLHRTKSISEPKLHTVIVLGIQVRIYSNEKCSKKNLVQNC